jgi:hypothetical protein
MLNIFSQKIHISNAFAHKQIDIKMKNYTKFAVIFIAPITKIMNSDK